MNENKLGLYLKRWRKNHTMTQEEFANKCGITRQTLNYIENGNKNVSVRTLKKIAVILHRTPFFLISLIEE